MTEWIFAHGWHLLFLLIAFALTCSCLCSLYAVANCEALLRALLGEIAQGRGNLDPKSSSIDHALITLQMEMRGGTNEIAGKLDTLCRLGNAMTEDMHKIWQDDLRPIRMTIGGIEKSTDDLALLKNRLDDIFKLLEARRLP